MYGRSGLLRVIRPLERSGSVQDAELEAVFRDTKSCGHEE